MHDSLFTTQYHTNGYAMLPAFFDKQEIAGIISALSAAGVFDYAGQTPAAQPPAVIPAIKNLITSPRILSVVSSIIGGNPEPGGAIILDKTADSNWGLDWHQDTKLAVKQQKEVPGYTGWAIEEGIPHVVAPAPVYNGVLYLRIHLDNCHSRNGGIWMLPGTHNKGLVDRYEVDTLLQQTKIEQCEAEAGDIMLMHPLLLHKSPYSLSKESRRILQVGYTATQLGGGLEWY